MVQHLEISPVLGVACSVYAQRPHLLQVSNPGSCWFVRSVGYVDNVGLWKVWAM
jgi:hypothetical protein